MSPTDCKPGVRVLYAPSEGGKRYAGLVAEDPWQLRHGTWVTRLVAMDPAYGADTGRPNRTHVPAAALEALEVSP